MFVCGGGDIVQKNMDYKIQWLLEQIIDVIKMKILCYKNLTAYFFNK